jgi:ribosome-dependent ATPase
MIELRTVHWYNPGIRSLVGMVPGLSAIVLSMPALAYGLSLARERELGSFERLITTPIQGTEYLLGKSIAYVTLGLGSVILTWLVAILIFRVPFRGSFVLYMALTALYLAATIGLVTALSPVLRSQQVAFFVVLAFFFVPSFFTSGLITPVLSTGWDRLSSDIFPATHYMSIARGIFVKGLGIGMLLRPTLILGGMCVGGLVIALLSFRKRLM